MERRFVREAKLGASLNHPNLVSVFDTATDDEGVLIVMEYVEGEALSKALRRGPLDPERVAAMMRDLGDALDHAHGQGVVHRDVKPGNVFLPRHPGDFARLADFGVAHVAGDRLADDEPITSRGALLGTPLYLSPEQCRGEAVDARSDLYAVGCVLYELLAGKPPFGGGALTDLIMAHIHTPPPALPASVPPALAALVMRLLAKAPGERPASCAEARP